MSVASQRTALLALLQGIPAIGLVHQEEPWAKGEGAFRELYSWQPPAPAPETPLPPRQIRGWFFTRVRTSETELAVGRVLNVHTWRIRGFLALQTPGSGVLFDSLIEAVRTAVRQDPTFGDAAALGALGQPTGAQLVESGPVVLAGSLCHGATLEVRSHEYL